MSVPLLRLRVWAPILSPSLSPLLCLRRKSSVVTHSPCSAARHQSAIEEQLRLPPIAVPPATAPPPLQSLQGFHLYSFSWFFTPCSLQHDWHWFPWALSWKELWGPSACCTLQFYWPQAMPYFMYQCSIGFSGILFSMIVMETSLSGVQSRRTLYDEDLHESFQNLATIFELSQKLVETMKAQVYNLITRLVHLVLTLPVTTATIERAFLAMKHVKSVLRNKMDNDYLLDSMVVYIERELSEDIDPDSIIDEFYHIKNRRAQLM